MDEIECFYQEIEEALFRARSEIKALIRLAGRVDSKLQADMIQLVTRWAQEWLEDHSPRPVAITMQIRGENGMASFNIVTTDTGAQVELQFTDPSGAPIDGPNDSVTGSPIVPVVNSDTPSVATVGTGTTGATPSPGLYVYPLTPVAAGTANISVAPLTNSDGSAVLETVGANAGQPFAVPSPIAINVEQDAASGLTITEVG